MSYQPKYNYLPIVATGDIVAVPAVPGKKIRVMGYNLSTTAPTAVQWKSGTAVISGSMRIATDGNLVVPYSPVGIMETGVAEALNLTVSAGTVGGNLVYIEIPGDSDS